MKQKFKLLFALMSGGITMTININAQVTGSGTIGKVPLWSGSSTNIGNSQIQDNGTNVGIGAAGSYKLDVNGDINVASGSTYKVGGSTVIKAGSAAKDFFGVSAGANITSGLNNAYYGYSAGWQNTTGYYNTCIGQWANGYNTSGSGNTVGGFTAGYYSGSGSSNTIFGKEAGYGVYNATPNNYSNNSFFGYQSGYGITTGSDNVFMGHSSGYSNTTGYNNIAIGSSANYANTTSSHNVAIGVSALRYNTGAANIAMGTTALYNNTSGTLNMGIGFQALYDNTTGSSNTAAGYQTMQNITTGSNNTGYGRNAIGASTTSDNNTGFGMNALSATTGYNNTAIGYSAGSYNTTGYNNTYVGYNANASNVGLNNSAAIGNGATTTATNMMYLGNANALLYCAGGVWTGSDGRFKTNVAENVKGLDFIKKLRPVTYTMNTEALDDFLIQNLPDSLKTTHKSGMDFSASSSVTHAGFIAQEVEQASQDAGFSSSIVHSPDNESTHYALNYAEFVVPLVKAVQELSKTADSLQTKTQSQDSINAAKDAQLQAMQNQLDQLTAAISACCTAGTTKSMQLNNSQENNSKDVELNNKNVVVLDQNVPNPFAEQTVINYYLPDNTERAQIIFLDQSGKLIKVVDLTEKGKGQLNVFASDLTNGVYTYSLVVDGKTVETKKMVTTK